jgi:iron complex outermembrane receptor protein
MWDVQNYVLQDIDRIEVIRGPGATLWGSNAVNGVINITTKNARDTQGLYVTTTAGSEDRASLGARYGGRLPGQGYYRVYAKFADRDGTLVRDAEGRRDDWQAGHAGFRADWESTAANAFTLQGDLYRTDAGQLQPAIVIAGRQEPPRPWRVDASGGNLLARWRHQTSTGSDIQLRAYYDRTHRDDPSFLDDLDTVDLDLQHRIDAGTRHGISWGANYRFSSNRNVGRVLFSLDPAESNDTLVGGFVQDQIEVLDQLQVTAGTKVEHNDFSGFEIQPSGRIVWEPSPLQTVWGAMSRAVRVPTRFERDFTLDASDPGDIPFLRLLGNPEFQAERLIAYEAGYRWQASPSVFVDLATFHNQYDALASLEPGDAFFDASIGQAVIPLRHENLTDGRASGVEALATLMAAPSWRLTASSSYLHLDLTSRGFDVNRGQLTEGATPRYQLGLRSYLDLPRAVQLDAMFRYLSAIESLQVLPSDPLLGAYAELDVRLAWRGWRDLELSLVGQNLLHDSHVEFGPPHARGEIQRGVYARAAWGF